MKICDTDLDSTQQQIADSITKAVKEPSPNLRSRSDPRDGTTLSALADIGLFGLGLPEDAGGSGFSVLEEIVAFREFGRNALVPSVLSQTIAAHAAHAAQNKTCLEILSRGARIGLAVCSASSDPRHYLIDHREADFLLVEHNRGFKLFPSDSFGGNASTVGIDDTLFVETATLLPGRSPICQSDSPALMNRAILLQAAMLAGLAEISRDTAVGYAKIRNQFGTPIGAFQAIKHKCADMALRCEAAWCQTVYAALEEDDIAGNEHSSAARQLATAAAIENSEENIQIHGGIGFTADCDAHILLKRSHVIRNLWR